MCQQITYKTVDELFKGAQPCSMFEELDAKRREEDSQKLSDEGIAREMEIWSEIGHLIVGHEGRLRCPSCGKEISR